ncbi:cupin domain-containing protein [Pedobacter frigiditerrae]|uniref:cupin domain-containing protein n=1 Tax=Pedobacter frigiditerrae TaxID=2530452 RepID=UPI002931C06F|nr:cupin domain-containing protein [Pedobacter frigiditerrae]
MNLAPYLESGMLALYVLDSLPNDEKLNIERAVKNHPELLQKISEIEMTFESYSDLDADSPRPALRGRIIDNIVNLQKEQVMNVNDLPIITAYSSYKNWLNFAKDLEMEPVAGKAIHVLREDEDVLQMVVTTTSGVKEESHPDVLESMLILEGECKFTVAGNKRIMKLGDFIDIPMNRVHDLELISPSLTVILQKIKV